MGDAGALRWLATRVRTQMVPRGVQERGRTCEIALLVHSKQQASRSLPPLRLVPYGQQKSSGHATSVGRWRQGSRVL